MYALGRFFLILSVSCAWFAEPRFVRADGLLGPLPPRPDKPPQTSAELSKPPAPGSPTVLIEPFYEHFGLELDPAQRNNFIDPAKKVLDDNDVLQSSGQGQCLDPNMALDNAAADKAQIAASLKTLESIERDQARVAVAFVEDEEPHRLEWKLKKVNSTWKIVDLLSVTGEWALSQYQCD